MMRLRSLVVVAFLALVPVAGCGEVEPISQDDAAVDDGSSADGGVGTADAAAPTCSDGLENGSEEGVDCGGSCGACVECAAPTECESGVCSSGTCAVTRFESCRDFAPTNAASTVADVVTTFTSGSGWSEPAACAWDCNADYDLSGEACINEREVQCTDVAPSNASSTISTVTISYTDAGQWAAPAECVWACEADYDRKGDTCSDQEMVSCNDAAPANASSTAAMVTISYSDEGGWTQPTDCAWSCDTDYAQDKASCIDERTVACNDAAPQNGVSVAANLTITYTTASGWTVPADCEWNCNTDYAVSADACIDRAMVPCFDTAPQNASSAVEDVEITYTTEAGWTTPAVCAWSCDTNYAQDGNACINSQMVSCSDAAPENASSTVAEVTITYTTAGGWSKAATCAWSCDADYAMDGDTCINSQQVPCENLFPANATTILDDTTITYTDAKGWSTAGACSFVCDANYCREGNACREATDIYYVEDIFDWGLIGGSWFGGDDRDFPSKPRNVGGGQRLQVTTDIDLGRFAFYYGGAFDSAKSGGPSVAVTLQLDLRDVNGVVLATTQSAVPASFAGGWVWFDIVHTLRADTPYYFTSFLVDGFELRVSSSIRMGYQDDYPAGFRSTSHDTSGTTDLASWPPWGENDSQQDYWFWVRSGPYCM